MTKSCPMSKLRGESALRPRRWLTGGGAWGFRQIKNFVHRLWRPWGPNRRLPRPSPRRPAMKGPVELSVEMDGHAFALRAPDLEGAAQIYEYAGRLLEDVKQAAAKLKEGTESG